MSFNSVSDDELANYPDDTHERIDVRWGWPLWPSCPTLRRYVHCKSMMTAIYSFNRFHNFLHTFLCIWSGEETCAYARGISAESKATKYITGMQFEYTLTTNVTPAQLIQSIERRWIHGEEALWRGLCKQELGRFSGEYKYQSSRFNLGICGYNSEWKLLGFKKQMTSLDLHIDAQAHWRRLRRPISLNQQWIYSRKHPQFSLAPLRTVDQSFVIAPFHSESL